MFEPREEVAGEQPGQRGPSSAAGAAPSGQQVLEPGTGERSLWLAPDPCNSS